VFKKQEICFGRKPVLEALRSGNNLERIFIRKGLTGPTISEIHKEARKQLIPVNMVPREKIDRLSNMNTQGVVAVVSPITYYKVEDIIDHCYSEGRDPLIVVLDGITDVGNFGAICRTSLGLNVDAVVIGHYRSAPVNAMAVKASAGALHHLKICRHKEIDEVLDHLRNSGIRIVAMDGKGESEIRECDLSGPLALLMGSEGFGLSAKLMDYVDVVARIPIDEKLESYNVSVAAAIALYEIRR